MRIKVDIYHIIIYITINKKNSDRIGIKRIHIELIIFKDFYFLSLIAINVSKICFFQKKYIFWCNYDEIIYVEISNNFTYQKKLKTKNAVEELLKFRILLLALTITG